MKTLTILGPLVGLAMAASACGNGPTKLSGADAEFSGGGGAGSGGAGGGSPSPDRGAGGGSGGAGVSADAAGPRTPTPLDSGARPDVGKVDGGTGISPPISIPPAPGSGCAPGCAALRAEYAESLLRAQRCTVGADNPCAMKAPGSLGCGGCQVWVNDTREVGPIEARFRAAGCDGCYFGGAPGENRCHRVGCPPLDFPMCVAAGAGQGTCVNREKDRTCPPALKTGSPCMGDADYCLGGGHVACYCAPMTMRWQCV